MFHSKAAARGKDYAAACKKTASGNKNNVNGNNSSNENEDGSDSSGCDLSSKLGENLFMMSGAKPGPSQAMTGWYSKEESQYSYDVSPGFSTITGHFSQIAWKSTTRLGCAAAKSKTGETWFWTCHFSKAGNVLGEFEEEVEFFCIFDSF